MTIINVALPEMRADLQMSVAGLQWIINGDTLTYPISALLSLLTATFTEQH